MLKPKAKETMCNKEDLWQVQAAMGKINLINRHKVVVEMRSLSVPKIQKR